MDEIDLGYFPLRTNLMAKVYQAVRDKHFGMLQTHLWDYKDPDVRENRCNEILLAAWEVLNERNAK